MYRKQLHAHSSGCVKIESFIVDEKLKIAFKPDNNTNQTNKNKSRKSDSKTKRIKIIKIYKELTCG